MNEKRYSHDAIVIVDHCKKDLIYIDGKDELLELAEYVDILQEENQELRTKNNAYLQDIEVYKEENTHLKLENEGLKEEIKAKDKIIELYYEMVKE